MLRAADVAVVVLPRQVPVVDAAPQRVLKQLPQPENAVQRAKEAQLPKAAVQAEGVAQRPAPVPAQRSGTPSTSSVPMENFS